MDHSFEAAFATPLGFLLSTIAAGGLVAILLRSALVPETRFTSWVRSVTGRNSRYLILVLIFVWIAGMAFLSSLGLAPDQLGGFAFIGLLIGFFLFMSFIWAVIGE
jgi:hypothetical protein